MTWRISGANPFIEPLCLTSAGATLRGRVEVALSMQWITSSLMRPSLRSLMIRVARCAEQGAATGMGYPSRKISVVGCHPCPR